MDPIFIKANSLPDAWFQCVYNVLAKGKRFRIDRGSYARDWRLEFDYITIQILKPWLRCNDGLPLLPEFPEGMDVPAPVTKDYVCQYVPYIMTPEKKPYEQYTYGQRLAHIFSLKHGTTNQIKRVINTYKKHGPRNNQMVLQVADPEDINLDDPPCLRHIDTRIQYGRLHFFPYFRSWDLWGGFPANLAGLSMLQEYMAGEIGVGQGEMICASKGLHLYSYSVDLAKVRCFFKEDLN